MQPPIADGGPGHRLHSSCMFNRNTLCATVADAVVVSVETLEIPASSSEAFCWSHRCSRDENVHSKAKNLSAAVSTGAASCACMCRFLNCLFEVAGVSAAQHHESQTCMYIPFAAHRLPDCVCEFTSRPSELFTPPRASSCI